MRCDVSSIGVRSLYEEYMANFDADSVKNDIVEWIRGWFDENGKNCNAIIGISGGKDSSVVAALCVEALGKDRVIGVLMPQGEQRDISDAQALVDHLGIWSVTVNIKNAVDSVVGSILNGWGEATGVASPPESIISRQTIVNLPPRIRMTTLYAIAQTWNGRVANTCNLSEDWVGYSTRYGDSVGDFGPISMLTTDEVVAVGISCGIPDGLVQKVPSDGLCGVTDEESLGFTYRVLNEYIRTGKCKDDDIRKIIDQKHMSNLFKLTPMPVFRYVPSCLYLVSNDRVSDHISQN